MVVPRKVYAIKHNQTNKTYVGSSADVGRRIREHINNLKRNSHPVEDMQADFNTYGENYSVVILDEILTYDDRYKEYAWMIRYGSYVRGKGYNYKDRKNFKIPIGMSINHIELSNLFKRNGYKRRDIAQILQITEKELNNRINSNYFYWDEISTLIDKLSITDPTGVFFFSTMQKRPPR